MPSLLHVIANPKPGNSSVSRQLATHFFRRRRRLFPEETIETLDLYCEDIPLLDAFTAHLFTAFNEGLSSDVVGDSGLNVNEAAPSWALAASDRYSAQFLRCDRVVLTCPMWNFGPPAILKAWIDLIVRHGATFEFTAGGVKPLAIGKSMLVIGARGGFYSGDSPLRRFDYLEPYLHTLFGFLGVEKFDAVWAEGTTTPTTPEAQSSLEQALTRLDLLAQVF